MKAISGLLMTTDIKSAWVIYYWEDIANAGYSKSWSNLKSEYAP